MNRSILEQIGHQIGAIEEIDAGGTGTYLGRFARIRVRININHPLKKYVCVRVNQKMDDIIILLAYERLPNFCYACGKIGHGMRDCDRGGIDINKPPFGLWLRAATQWGNKKDRSYTPMQSKGISEDIEKICANFWWGVDNGQKKMHWKTWDSLCKPKSLGGMGFRKLEVFNKALLAKQIWRMVTNPNSLTTRVLKSRYFRHSDIMNAELGSNPSYLWRSLIWGRELLQEGIMWRVGDGRSVHVYHDKWIPNLQSCLGQLLPNDIDQTKVQSLITNGRWNEELINTKFPSFVATEIATVPLPSSSKDDSRFWRYDPKGKYSVRDGYKVGMGVYIPLKNQPKPSLKSWWKFLWSLSIPPKVRIFWWKVSNNSIPTRWNLLVHHVPTNGHCPICNFGMETTSHALFECTTSRAAWKKSNFWHITHRIHGQEILDTCCWLMYELGKGEFEKMAVYSWAIWKERTRAIHNPEGPEHSSNVDWCLEFLDEYQRAEQMEVKEPAISYGDPMARWQLPTPGTLRLDVDASFNQKSNSYAIGGALRDHTGKLLLAFGQQTHQPISVTHGELMALRKGLNIVLENGFQKIHVATDSLLAVQAVTNPQDELGYIGTIAAEINSLISSPRISSFGHIKRSANAVAHALAKFSVSSPTLFYLGPGEFPPWLVELVLKDI